MLAATVGILQPLPVTLKVSPGQPAWKQRMDRETAKLAQVGAYETSVKTEGAGNAWGFGREVLAL